MAAQAKIEVKYNPAIFDLGILGVDRELTINDGNIPQGDSVKVKVKIVTSPSGVRLAVGQPVSATLSPLYAANDEIELTIHGKGAKLHALGSTNNDIIWVEAVWVES